ncbi:hypothetical protein BS636_06470 [Acinetobacter sp. LoGeW2-3]|uniref:TorF family putative porin n=1 Tax=Acinetobacter sp. LoGeW2-3 TaxID=1808001 RepID=UPI000C059EBB|nr:TorF family putative porin [Acinetobacter sp. LoGeW2-3]ATO19327.1 hypothetical protein BS636_06470 [Acinetobacter sp. LoGeW2-3]
MKFTLKALAVAAVASASSFTFADEPTSPHSVSGNIGVLSSYNLRGNTALPENDKVTLQGGLDYSHASGLYAGWWTSTLDGDDAYPDQANPMEHDFYVGYNGSINEDLGFTLGTTYYYYYDVGTSDFNGFELLLGLNYKDASLTAQTLLEDTGWGNTGDTYFLASYSYALPKDFSLNSSLGLYYYSDSGDFEGENYITTEDFNFRHLTVGLSKPIADTGVTASMDYIIGGKLRDDTDLKNKVVLGLSYSF